MRTRILVDEFIVSRRSRSKSKATAAWYRSILGKFAAAFKELPGSPRQIEDYLGSLELASTSRWDHYRVLRIFYNFCHKRHRVLNPMPRVEAPIHRRPWPVYLTDVQVAWLLAVPLQLRDRALIMLLVDTGVRIGEALNLCREDIQADYIRICGKTGEREVPISAGPRDLLLELRRKGHIFMGSKGPLGYTGARDIIRKALSLAGIEAKKRGPHVLRHTFGRQYILAGGDLASLQRIMGHSNIKTTQVYSEMDLRDITRQHQKFSPLLAAAKLFADHKPELRPEIKN